MDARIHIDKIQYNNNIIFCKYLENERIYREMFKILVFFEIYQIYQ